eukprot:TRINITY_DN8325_c0_g1_i2.p1 TRINITY_DN8325_c0_g1~~TRINITY_DN8325_c0_g1_i2.p1  ORF type:complete len:592 (+),score=55.40 TRINITY_DN8325_c0_g1_i2:98-1873(+)
MDWARNLMGSTSPNDASALTVREGYARVSDTSDVDTESDSSTSRPASVQFTPPPRLWMSLPPTPAHGGHNHTLSSYADLDDSPQTALGKYSRTANRDKHALKAEPSATVSMSSHHSRLELNDDDIILEEEEERSKMHIWCTRPASCCLNCFAACGFSRYKLESSRFCSRWFIIACSLITFMLVFATIMCIMIWAVGPVIAQKMVDDGDMELVEMTMTDPGYRTVMLNATARISTNLPIHLEVKVASAIAKLSYQGVTVGKLKMPAFTITAGEASMLPLVGRLDITNMDAFVHFGKDMINSKSVKMTMSASTSATAMGGLIDYSLTLTKTLVVKGANGLSDMSIVSTDFSLSNATHIVIALVADVMNPSQMAISPIGSLAATMHYKGSKMADVTSAPITLKRGWNKIQMFGVITSKNMTQIDELISRYLAGKNSTVSAVVNAVDGSSIPLYARLLANFAFKTNFRGNTSLSLVNSVNATSLAIEPVNNTYSVFEQGLAIEVNNILGKNSPINMTSVLLNCSLSYPRTISTNNLAANEGTALTTRDSTAVEWIIVGRIIMNSSVPITDGTASIIKLNVTVGLLLDDGGKNMGT